MKRSILIVVSIFTCALASAQVGEGSNWLKVGAHIGIPVADSSNASSFMTGIDLKYQFLGKDSFALGAATGYSNYFGKDDSDDSGIVPLAALFRFYPTNNFFIGTDLGYGFLTGRDETNGGFYYRPEVGYHNDAWNIFAFYQGVSVDGASVGAVGIGVNYNLIQGQK